MPQQPESSPAKRKDLIFHFASLVAIVVLVSVAFLAFVRWGFVPLEYGGLKPGQVAPPIQAQAWIGGRAPEDLSGKVIVLDAWASW